MGLGVIYLSLSSIFPSLSDLDQHSVIRVDQMSVFMVLGLNLFDLLDILFEFLTSEVH